MKLMAAKRLRFLPLVHIVMSERDKSILTMPIREDEAMKAIAWRMMMLIRREEDAMP